jgi:hypothetical protein
MAQHARTNIENLGIMIYRAKFEEGGKE